MEHLDFLCRRFPIERVLKCSFALNTAELKVLKLLSNTADEYTLPELQKELKRERSTIQRAVKSLSEKSLIRRRQINRDFGGYYFVYASLPKERIKEMMFENLNRFRDTVGKELERW